MNNSKRGSAVETSFLSNIRGIMHTKRATNDLTDKYQLVNNLRVEHNVIVKKQLQGKREQIQIGIN